MSTTTQALKLEVSIVEALLSRNCSSHGRTIYHRRLQMVLQCIRKCNLLDFASRLKRQLHENSKKDRERSTREKNEELEYLTSTLSDTFPELVSRIEHAAKALFAEIGRGFFLPYCTVAASAIARIRILILQMGQESIIEMHKIGIDLSNCLQAYSVDEDAVKQKSATTSHFKLLAKSLGVVWESRQDISREDNLTQSSDTQELASPRAPGENAIQDTPALAVQIHDESFHEDLGLHVGMDRKNPVLAAQSERVDHNMEIMMDTKLALSKKKKRKASNSNNATPLKSKKSKTKKKDFFDELFGG